jgi:hypothetical protein
VAIEQPPAGRDEPERVVGQHAEHERGLAGQQALVDVARSRHGPEALDGVHPGDGSAAGARGVRARASRS